MVAALAAKQLVLALADPDMYIVQPTVVWKAQVANLVTAGWVDNASLPVEWAIAKVYALLDKYKPKWVACHKMHVQLATATQVHCAISAQTTTKVECTQVVVTPLLVIRTKLKGSFENSEPLV